MAEHDRAHPPGWIQQLLARHEASLIRYAYRITRNAEQARDVVQETFLKLCREFPTEINGHATAWLYTVCRHRAIDMRRKEQRMSPTLDVQQLTTDETQHSPHDAVVMQDEFKQVYDRLKHLPENQQEAIRLKFQSGLSYKEISEVTGESISQVGVLIHRGIKTLRQQCGVRTISPDAKTEM
ncbi:MAG: sigma-70 family RNA polymerase sigma factor [Planctomycetota bacterium]|nr:sigma-70 family RNA polymerase sigma factor [Planctomycetota bacterium]MDA1215170.1 sigma-70 family RNA polymerase sigma factor [Planctomycetota bacterium]